MSSNYRILLYFLKNLDHSLKIGLGLRNRSIDELIRKDILNDLKKNVTKNCRSLESMVNTNCRQESDPKNSNNPKNV